ncbi:MAG: hypothetical protein ABI723_02315 [Bacteroidia bacterium]
MSTKELIEKIEALPIDLRERIEKKIEEAYEEFKIEKKPLKAGFGKGTISYISDDFDEPMELIDTKEIERLRAIENQFNKRKLE